MLAVSPLSDLAAVQRLCSDPYIARAGHDHRPLSAIDHPDVHYLAATLDGEIVGAFCVIDSGFVERDVHALLQRRALPWSRDLGRLCIAWCFSAPWVQRLTAQIIEGLEAARNYCVRLGFRVEGFKRDACQVGGRIVGVHVLGLTRSEWEAA